MKLQSPFTNPENARLLYVTAWSMSIVAAIFCLVLGALMTANYLQVKRSDPLNDPLLVKLRNEAVADPANLAVKETVRGLDLLARRAYFAGQDQLRNGTILLICGAIIIVALLNLAGILRQQLPNPEEFPVLETLWTELTHRRTAIAIAGGVLILMAVAAALLSRTELNRETIQNALAPQPAPGNTTQPAPSPQPAPVPAAPTGVPRETWLKQWPNFRGPDGVCIAHVKDAPTAWDGKAATNIKWKTAIPLRGFSSPIVWDTRVFLTGGNDKDRALYCLDADTGAITWTASDAQVSGAPTEPPKVSDNTGWAAPTPATDGALVFAIFANGNLIAADMTGKIAWSKNVGVPKNHYAHSSSLIVWNNLLFVQVDDEEVLRLFAFDAATGKEVWQAKRQTISWASPICVNTGSRWELILTDGAGLTSYDPSTGKELWAHACLSGEVAPSAGYANGLAVAVNTGAAATGLKLSDGKPAELWKYDEELPDAASALVTGPFVFLATPGSVIVCLDAATGKPAWTQEFDEGFTSSPILVGDRVYATDVGGVTHVFAAANPYKKIATNPLGEGVMTTPAVVEGRLFIRGEKHLYCIEQPRQVAGN